MLARKLTLLSDIGFAAVMQRVEPMAPDIMETLLVELFRFQVEAADLAREMAPARSAGRADYEQRCDMPALDALRQAIFLRYREVARDPLSAVAARPALELDEQQPDWQRLAMRALRAMIGAKEETMRCDQGLFDGLTGLVDPLAQSGVVMSDRPPRRMGIMPRWDISCRPLP